MTKVVHGCSMASTQEETSSSHGTVWLQDASEVLIDSAVSLRCLQGVLDGESLRVPLPVASAGRNVKNVKNVSCVEGCSALVGNKEVILLNSRRGAGGD